MNSIEQKDLHRLDKVLLYLQSQIKLNELTRAHLKDVLGKTEDVSHKLFTQLESVYESIEALSRRILSFQEHESSLHTTLPALLDENRKIINCLTEPKLESQETIIPQIRDYLEKLQNVIKKSSHLNSDDLAELNERIALLSQSTMDSLGLIQFQDIARQQIELIFRYLDDSDDYMKSLSLCVNQGNHHCDGTCSVPEFDLDSILKYYVMNRQREIHYEVLGTGSKDEKSVQSSDDATIF